MPDRSNLNLARQFMSGRSRPGSPNTGRYPDMSSFSRTPMGQELMSRVLRNVQGRKRRPGQPQRQVKRETTEYFDGQAQQGLSNTGRRP